eukprot:g499.t1
MAEMYGRVYEATLAVRVGGDPSAAGECGSIRVPVAVKTFLVTGAEDADDPRHPVAAALREAKVMGNLRHANLVQTIGVIVNGASSDQIGPLAPSLVMELVPRNLAKVAADETVSLEARIWLVYDVACGLDALHKYGIVHHDVKTCNILVTAAVPAAGGGSRTRPIAKVADFGMSTVHRASRTTGASRVVGAGTCNYAAPETFKEKYTSKSDVYSWALVAIAALTGIEPWVGLEAHVIMAKIVNPFADLPEPALEAMLAAAPEMRARIDICNRRPPVPDACPAVVGGAAKQADWDELVPAMRKIVHSSWQDHPEDRPSFDTIMTDLNASVLPKVSAAPGSDPSFADHATFLRIMEEFRQLRGILARGFEGAEENLLVVDEELRTELQQQLKLLRDYFAGGSGYGYQPSPAPSGPPGPAGPGIIADIATRGLPAQMPAGFTERDLFFSFCRLLIDEMPKQLRVLFKAVWDAKYGPALAWGGATGRDDLAVSGDRFLFGPDNFTVDLGLGEVRAKSVMIGTGGQDFRGGIKVGGQPNHRCVFDGSRVLVTGHGAVEVQAVQQTRLKMANKWPGDDGRVALQVPLKTRPRDIYDLNVSPPGRRSAIGGKDVQRHVLAGDTDAWDTTVLLFALLNSAHLLLDGHPAVKAALDVAGVRGVRNVDYGHVEHTQMSWAQFKQSVQKLVDAAKAMDALGLPGVGDCTTRFCTAIEDMLRQPVGEVDVRRYQDTMLEWRRALHGEVQAIGRGVRSLVAYHQRLDELGAAHPLHDNVVVKIKEKRVDFTGREWLFKKVAELLHGDGKGLVVTGGAGIGKSSWLAELVANGAAHGLEKHRVVAKHFCDANDVDTLDAKKFATGLLVSFAHSLPGFEAQVYELVAGCETLAQVREVYDDKSADSMLTKVVLPALKKLGKPAGDDDDCCLLCLDSLDEALLAPGGEDKSIVKLLYSRSVERNWPAWLRVVATSRPQEKVLKLLKKIKRVDLAFEDNHKENIEDVTKFVDQTVRRDKAQASVSDEAVAGFAAQIAERSGGMFQFAKLVLEDMDDDLSADDLQLRVDRLPSGLYEWYQDRFEALYPEDKIGDFLEEARPVLAVLLAARAPMPLGLLQQAAGFADKKQLLVKALSKISAFCPAGGAMGGRLGGDEDKTYTFVHKSFPDWLQDEEENGDFLVEARRGEELLARAAVEMVGRVAALSKAVDAKERVQEAASRAQARAQLEALGGVGAKIEVDIDQGESYPARPGTIVQINDNGTAQIDFDDGDTDNAVIPAHIRGDAQSAVRVAEANVDGTAGKESHGKPKKDSVAEYLLQHGLRHAVAAGRAADAADKILLDFGFLFARAAVGPPQAPREDARYMMQALEAEVRSGSGGGDGGAGGTKELLRSTKLVESALRASIPHLRTQWRQLAGQLVGRLIGYGGRRGGGCGGEESEGGGGGDGGEESKNDDDAWFVPRIGRLLEETKAGMDEWCGDDGRGWVYPLYRTMEPAGGPLQMTLEGHSDDVNSVALNGNLLASSGSRDKKIKIWDTESGECVKTLQGHSESVNSVAWNGKLLASGSSDKTIKIWDTESGACVKTLGDDMEPYCDEDGDLDEDKYRLERGKIWDTESGACVKTLEGHSQQVTSVAWNGKLLASGSWDNTIKIWDAESGECVKTLEGHSSGMTSVAWNGKLLASGSSDKTIKIWDTESGACVKTLGDADEVEPYCDEYGYLDERKYRLEGGKIWDAESGECVKTLEGHSESVHSVAWNGKLLASGSRDKTIKIWDTESGACVKTLEGHSGWVESVVWHGKLLASGSRDKTIKIWDTESGACFKTLEGHSSGMTSVAWNGKLLASGSASYDGESYDGEIKIWDTESGACVKTLEGHSDWVRSVAWNGKLLASGSVDGEIKIWDTESGACVKTLEGHSSGVKSVAWNGKLLASGSWDNTIKIWDTESGACVKTLEGHSGGVQSVAWNGKLLASGSEDNTIKIWDTESGACVKTLEGHSSGVKSVAWNGKLLASGSRDKTIKIWDTESGACVKTLEKTNKLPDEFIDGKLEHGSVDPFPREEGEERSFDLSDAADLIGMTFDGDDPDVHSPSWKPTPYERSRTPNVTLFPAAAPVCAVAVKDSTSSFALYIPVGYGFSVLNAEYKASLAANAAGVANLSVTATGDDLIGPTEHARYVLPLVVAGCTFYMLMTGWIAPGMKVSR